VPSLPPKNPFGFQDEAFLRARERDLESWMKALAEIPLGGSGVDPMKTGVMQQFLVQVCGAQNTELIALGRAAGASDHFARAAE